MYKQKFISKLNNQKWKEEFQDVEDDIIQLPPSEDEEIQQVINEEVPNQPDVIVQDEEIQQENKKIEWLDSDIEGIDDIDDEEEEIRCDDAIDHDKQTVFVQNLPLRVSDQEIHDFFSKFGTILKLDVARNEGSQFTKGRAFIEFVSPHEAEEIACKNLVLKGRELLMRVGIQERKEVVKSQSDEIRSRSRSQSK